MSGSKFYFSRNLIKFFIYKSIFLIFIIPTITYADVHITGDIKKDTVWTETNNPYIVDSNITITSNKTLTINPGTIVKFNGSSLNVEGILRAQGTSHKKIYFTSTTDNEIASNNVSSSSKLWGGIQLKNLKDQSTISNIVIKYADNALYMVTSSTTLEHIDIFQSSRGIIIDKNSSIAINDLHASDIENNAVSVYNASSLFISSSTIENIFKDYAIDIYNNSHITLHNLQLKNLNSGGIGVYSSSTATINNLMCDKGFLHGCIDGYNNSQINIQDSIFKNFTSTAISLFGSTLLAHKIIVRDNSNGIEIIDDSDNNVLSSALITDSSLYNNLNYAILNFSSTTVKSENNWWGDSSGPLEVTQNPKGKGNMISSNIKFWPWNHFDPDDHKVCCSSVAFIPGMELSRLYIKGLYAEKRLWEPSFTTNSKNIYLDQFGKSLISNIYTRDIVDRGFGFSIYSNFIKFLNELTKKGTIKDWKSFPYDWRLNINSIVEEGVELADSKIYKMIPELEYLAASSLTGKVTLITHSNGVLIAKKIISSLINKGEINIIDKVIFVAPPEFGTPEAIPALLHGDDQQILHGFVLQQRYARGLALNMSSVYNLLPSQTYFEDSTSSIIEFDPSIDKITNLRKIYGNNISSFSSLFQFLQNTNVNKKPTFADLDTPATLNRYLIENAIKNHQLLDHINMPITLQTVRIVGWGIPTLAGIRYKSERRCYFFYICTAYKLRHDQILTINGDGTVVNQSVSNKSGNIIYYIDLKRLNKDLKQNKKHEDILEIPILQEFLLNIMKDDNKILKYITQTKPTSTIASLYKTFTT